MSTPSLKITEGEVDFHVPSAGKPCKTWFKVIGDLKSRRPLVALHGGPGLDHAYLLILSDLTEEHGIPLILYDQIGNGNSTHLPEKMGDASFWTDQLFLDELDNLLCHLGVQDDYDLLGQSWGGMLAARHAVRQPKGLKRLVLFSTPASMQLWVEAANSLLAELPEELQKMFKRHEENGTTDSEEYQKGLLVYYSRFLCRLDPKPAPVLQAFECIRRDPTVYLTMCGASEFHVTGTLKDWSVIDDAHKISVPTLLLNGRYDEARDSVVAPFFAKIPRVRWATFAESSHLSHYEERERFMQVVGTFLV